MAMNAYEKGCKAALAVGDDWPELCQKEVENVDLTSKGEITHEKAEDYELKTEFDEVNSSINAIPGEKSSEAARSKRKIGFLSLFCALLGGAGEAFLIVWTFDPFPEIGLKKYLISLTITLVSVFSFDRIFKYLSDLTTKRILAILSLFMAIATGILAVVVLLNLAWVRGSLLQTLIGSRMGASTDAAAIDFYRHSGPMMKVLFAAMAVAIVLGAALMMREAGGRIVESSYLLKLLKRRQKIKTKMAQIPYRIEKLEASPRTFEREYSRGAIETLGKIKKGEEKREKGKDKRLIIALVIFVAVLLCLLVLIPRLFAGELVVVGLDVSVSELAVDYQGQTEFAKNVTAIGERIVPNLGPDSDLFIVGITGNTLASPYCILRGRTGKERGYFGELLRQDLQRIGGDWEKASRSLKPVDKYTDILGFFSLSELIFNSLPSDSRTLVLLSDTRHCTATLNLERPERLDPKMLEKLKGKIHIPNLEGVNIHIHGVHSFGKKEPDLYYYDLRRFWSDYLMLTKGTLKTYSPLRDINFGKERKLP